MHRLFAPGAFARCWLCACLSGCSWHMALMRVHVSRGAQSALCCARETRTPERSVLLLRSSMHDLRTTVVLQCFAVPACARLDPCRTSACMRAVLASASWRGVGNYAGVMPTGALVSVRRAERPLVAGRARPPGVVATRFGPLRACVLADLRWHLAGAGAWDMAAAGVLFASCSRRDPCVACTL